MFLKRNSDGRTPGIWNEGGGETELRILVGVLEDSWCEDLDFKESKICQGFYFRRGVFNSPFYKGI